MLPNELLIAPFFATDVNDFVAENNIVVYPNPAHAAFVVKTKQSAFSAGDRVQLFSMTGQLLYATSISSQETKVDITSCPQGTYMLRAVLNGQQQSMKILKE